MSLRTSSTTGLGKNFSKTQSTTATKKCEDNLYTQLKDGITALYRNGEWALDHYPYAEGDSIIVGKNTKEALHAHGGGCRVVIFYNPHLKLGALIHLDVVSICGKEYKELTKALLRAFSKLKDKNTIVILCGDKGEAGIKKAFEEWDNKILSCLGEAGFTKVEKFSKDNGKDVFLDVYNGTLEVKNDEEETILKRRL